MQRKLIMLCATNYGWVPVKILSDLGLKGGEALMNRGTLHLDRRRSLRLLEQPPSPLDFLQEEGTSRRHRLGHGVRCCC